MKFRRNGPRRRIECIYYSGGLVTRSLATGLLLVLAAPRASAATIRDYAILAGHQVTFSGYMNASSARLARLGSNGDITVGSATPYLTTVEAGGSLLGNPSFLDVQNNMVFNGNVQFGGLSAVAGNIDVGGTAIVNSTVQGNVSALGDITIGGTVNGNAVSNGSVTLSTFGKVGQNVSANQNVTLAQDSSISGNVTYGNQLSIGTFSTIGGTQTHGLTVVSPVHYVPVPISADSFVTGGANLSSNFAQTTVIAPGHYGALSIAAGTVKLSPGQYFFDSVIATSSFMHLDLDLSQPGNIEVFVKGDYDIPLQIVSVNGVDAASVDPQLGKRVLVESLGNIHLGWDNLGTLFAPTGDISLDGLTNVWGAAISGHDATFGSGDQLIYVPSNHFAVPEPTSIGLLALAVLFLCGWRRITRRCSVT